MDRIETRIVFFFFLTSQCALNFELRYNNDRGGFMCHLRTSHKYIKYSTSVLIALRATRVFRCYFSQRAARTLHYLYNSTEQHNNLLERARARRSRKSCVRKPVYVNKLREMDRNRCFSVRSRRRGDVHTYRISV